MLANSMLLRISFLPVLFFLLGPVETFRSPALGFHVPPVPSRMVCRSSCQTAIRRLNARGIRLRMKDAMESNFPTTSDPLPAKLGELASWIGGSQDEKEVMCTCKNNPGLYMHTCVS
jgi:hypothetical protein